MNTPRDPHLSGAIGGPIGDGIGIIATGRSEVDVAQQYRERALKMLDELCTMMTKARQADGMTVAFQIAGPDGFGRYSLSLLEITKKLC